MEKQHIDFDDFAEDYRKIHTKNVQGISGADSSYFGEFKVKTIWEDLHVRERDKNIQILDLGCGDGMNSVYFKKYFCKIDYFGIDISEESIKQARKISSKNVKFEVYDGKNIPYDKNSFDIILLACVLHHVPHEEHAALLTECRRVLKDSGRMYIFEHNPINPVTRKIVNDCVFDKDAVLVKQRKLRALLDKLDYSKIEVAYTIFFPRKGMFEKIIPLEKRLKWLPLGGQYYIRCEK